MAQSCMFMFYHFWNNRVVTVHSLNTLTMAAPQQPGEGARAMEADEGAEPQQPSESGGGTADAADCVVALIENRAREVGLAILHPHSLSLTLVQVKEARSYSNTRLLLATHEPAAILVVSSDAARGARGSVGGGVNAALMGLGFTVLGLGRHLFDDTKGLLLCESYSPASSAHLLQGCRASHYLALGAAGALLQYIAQERALLLTPGCLTISKGNAHRHLAMGHDAIESLELVGPTNVSGRSRHDGSLLALLNRCKTVGGARLLRTNLLQPLVSRCRPAQLCLTLLRPVSMQPVAHGPSN